MLTLSPLKYLITVIITFLLGYLVAIYQYEDNRKIDDLPETNKIVDHGLVTPTKNSELNGELSENKAQPIRDVDPKQDIYKREIPKLKAKLQQLNQQIALKDDEIFELQESISANHQKAKKPEATALNISKERAESLLEKPFSRFFVDASGKRAAAFEDFQTEPQDYDWAYIMEINIKDFAAIHPKAPLVNLQSVSCKSKSCEILGFESEQQSWQVIISDMREQEWWVFANTTSSSSTSEDFGQFFYTLLSK